MIVLEVARHTFKTQVDVFVLDDSNFLYYRLGKAFSSLARQLDVGPGLHEFKDIKFAPAAGEKYYLVIDNTDAGTSACSYASGQYELVELCVVSGNVHVTGTTTPIPGATVYFQSTNSAESASVVTDANGHYSIDAGVRTGTYTVRVSASGYLTAISSVTVTHTALGVNFALTKSQHAIEYLLRTGEADGATYSWTGTLAREVYISVFVIPQDLRNPYVDVYFLDAENANNYRNGRPFTSIVRILQAAEGKHESRPAIFTPVSGANYFLIVDNTAVGSPAVPLVAGWCDLLEACVVTGHVTTGGIFTSVVLPGATVEFEPGGYSAVTGLDGGYTVNPILGGEYTVKVSHPGYVMSLSKHTVAGRSCHIDLDLARLVYTVSGHVRNMDPDATLGELMVKGATVGLSPGGYFGVANDLGFYSISGVPGGKYTVIGFARGYQVFSEPILIGDDTQIDVPLMPEVETDTHEFYLWYGQHVRTVYQWTDTITCSLHVSVMVEEDADTATDDYVEVLFLDFANAFKYSMGQPFTSIIQGRAFEGGKPKILTAESFTPVVGARYILIMDNTEYGGPPVVGNDGFVHGWYHVYPTYTVNGQVRIWGTSTGVPDAKVVVSPSESSVITDSTGCYTISGIRDGATLMSVYAEGYEFVAQAVSIVTNSEMNFFLRPNAEVNYKMSGYVLASATSAPIPNATVILHPGEYNTTSDMSGHYSLSGLPNGTYTASVSAKGYHSSDLTVKVDGVNIYQDVYLSPWTYNVSGTVYRSETTTTIPGANVVLSPGGQAAVTDAAGGYSIKDVLAGSYTATVSASGYDTSTVDITVADADLQNDFELTASRYSVSGHAFVLGSSTGIPGATVSISPGTGSAITNSSGYFELTEIAAGSYMVTVSASGYQDASEVVTVSDRNVTLDFELQVSVTETYTINGHVYDQATELPIEGATVSLTPSAKSAETDSAGHYSLEGVSDGSYDVTASAPGYASSTRTVTISGADLQNDIALATATYSMSGFVHVAGSSTGVQEASISLSPGSRSGVTDNTGHYSISGILAGSYTVKVSAGGYCTLSATVVVSAQDVTRDFELEPESTARCISGQVFDQSTGEPIEGAAVGSGAFSCESNRTGCYSLIVPDGTYIISVSADGYERRNVTVTVSGNNITRDVGLDLVEGKAGTSNVSWTTAGIVIVVVAAVAAGLGFALSPKRRRG